MHDPFEQSLRDMLQSPASERDHNACLGRVLKTANRQVGAGALFGLLGHCVGALLLGVSKGAAHVAPVSRASETARTQSRSTDKVD